MRKLNNFFIFLISVLSIFYTYRNYSIGAYNRLFSNLSILIVLFIPKIVNKVFKNKITKKMEFIYILFIFFAQFLGCIVGLYNKVWWYDLFVHFLSGILTSVFALIIIKWTELSKEKNMWFNLLFMNCFTLMIASLWEFLEFATFIFFHMDVQHHLTTGVFDTMEDMLVAFLGNIIVCIAYLIAFKRKNYNNKVINK